MKNEKKIKALKKFLNSEDEEQTIVKKDGLIERINKTYITESGKQLLKEIYR